VEINFHIKKQKTRQNQWFYPVFRLILLSF